MGKCTYVSQFGIEGAKEKLEKITNEAIEEINVYETRKKWLLESKPSCYRKKKLESYQKEVIALDAKICHYYQELEREIELNIKMGTVLKDE